MTMKRFFPFTSRDTIPSWQTFTITELGRDQLDRYTGDAKSRIIMAINGTGAANTAEIARAAKLPKGYVERSLPSLINGGYVKPVRGESGG